MLRIFAAFTRTHPEAVLVWGGVIDEKDRKHLEELQDALGIRGKVMLLGRYPEIWNLLQAMDVFLFPSLYEGLGIVLIEAQTAGLPCIISDTIPEEADVTNLVTRVGLEQSPEEWADIVASKLVYERHGRKDEVQEMGYGIRSIADQMEQLYLEAEIKGKIKSGEIIAQ
jgi:glycosyltransferase involved in cell wall biosynthesis